MDAIVLVTRNMGKFQEIRNLMPDSYVLKSLEHMGFAEEIEETGSTFIENSLLKAKFIYNKFHVNTLADDSGLEVEALGGKPGVFSARYAGSGSTDAENVNKLLKDLEGFTDRKARFKTTLALIINGTEHTFEGTVEGRISYEPAGNRGFGYDPVFVPSGYDKTFAELPFEVKNKISHRAEAMRKLIDFLLKNSKK